MISQGWTAPDGAELSYLVWAAEGEERFRALLLHGMGSTAYEFAVLGEFLAALGGAVFALNQRGNGLDPEPARRGHDFSWEQFREDFAAWRADIGREFPVPEKGGSVFLLGESLGGLEAILCGSDRTLAEGLSGVILLNPVVELRQKTPEWLVAVLRGVARLFPRLVISPFWFVHGRGEPLVLTRDPAYQEHMATSPYRVPAFTLKHTVEVGKVVKMAQGAAESLAVPVLHLVSGKDAFLDAEQARAWFERVGAKDKTLVEFPEAHHILLHDWDAAKVLAEIERWISARLPIRRPQATSP
jgi:alpha-beta hydrolase superfamily lysophospholipase